MSAKAEMILADAKSELSPELFASFYDSIIEQSQATPEAGEAIKGYLSGAIEKRDDLVEFLKAWEAEGARLKERAKVIADRVKEIQLFTDRVRDCIKLQMELLGVRRVDGQIHRMSLRAGTDRVVIDDESAIPAAYLNYNPVPDKDAISKALHAGTAVPGCHLETGQNSIVIR